MSYQLIPDYEKILLPSCLYINPAFRFFIFQRAGCICNLCRGNRNGNWGNPAIWQVSLPVGGGPPNPCNNCTIVINSDVTMNIFDQQITGSSPGASTIIISGGASLTVQQFMTMQNTAVTVSSNAALNVNDELHLYTTTITLNNTTSVVSTLNPFNWVSHGTIDPGDPGGAGLYYNRDGIFPLRSNDFRFGI